MRRTSRGASRGENERTRRRRERNGRRDGGKGGGKGGGGAAERQFIIGAVAGAAAATAAELTAGLAAAASGGPPALELWLGGCAAEAVAAVGCHAGWVRRERVVGGWGHSCRAVVKKTPRSPTSLHSTRHFCSILHDPKAAFESSSSALIQVWRLPEPAVGAGVGGRSLRDRWRPAGALLLFDTVDAARPCWLTLLWPGGVEAVPDLTHGPAHPYAVKLRLPKKALRRREAGGGTLKPATLALVDATEADLLAWQAVLGAIGAPLPPLPPQPRCLLLWIQLPSSSPGLNNAVHDPRCPMSRCDSGPLSRFVPTHRRSPGLYRSQPAGRGRVSAARAPGRRRARRTWRWLRARVRRTRCPRSEAGRPPRCLLPRPAAAWVVLAGGARWPPRRRQSSSAGWSSRRCSRSTGSSSARPRPRRSSWSTRPTTSPAPPSRCLFWAAAGATPCSGRTRSSSPRPRSRHSSPRPSRCRAGRSTRMPPARRRTSGGRRASKATARRARCRRCSARWPAGCGRWRDPLDPSRPCRVCTLLPISCGLIGAPRVV